MLAVLMSVTSAIVTANSAMDSVVGRAASCPPVGNSWSLIDRSDVHPDSHHKQHRCHASESAIPTRRPQLSLYPPQRRLAQTAHGSTRLQTSKLCFHRIVELV